ncbi:MAG TPA: glycosyltransferase [Flavisolibacter sp.]
MRLIFTSYAHVAQYDHPGEWLGRIAPYTALLEALAADHEVIAMERINWQGQLSRNGVQYLFARDGKAGRLFPWHVHRTISRLRPAAVFINGFVFPLQLIQLRLQLGWGVKIFVIHRAEHPSRGVRGLLQKVASRCIDAYLLASMDHAREWINAGVFPDAARMRALIPASSVFSGNISPEDEERAHTYLWVGRLNANKDPITVVRAFSRFLGKHPRARLFMIFQEDELLPDVAQLVRETGTGSSILLVGKVPHHALQPWFEKAGFFISGSHYESCGIALIEAMSCGCVPVVTDIPSFRNITGNGACGLLYSPGDADQLTRVLEESQALDLEKQQAAVMEQYRFALSFSAIARNINRILNEGREGEATLAVG